MKPRVSVIVPCFNRAHFLKPTIDSILRQNYADIECIVIDAQSSDGTVDILKSYGNKIRWVSEHDNGHADAINKGWRMSSGGIVAWLNADDCWAVPDAVSEAVAYLETRPDVDVVYGQVERIDKQGSVIGPGYWKRWDLHYAVERCDHCIPQPAAFIRRAIAQQVGWLDAQFQSKKDHEFWLRVALAGKIEFVPRVWAQERVCPGYLAHRGDITARACVALTKKFFSLPGVPDSLRRRERMALSCAYLRGARYAALEGGHYWFALRYGFMGLSIWPANAASVSRYALRKLLERLAAVRPPGRAS